MGKTDLTEGKLSVGLWEKKKAKTKNSFLQSGPSPQTQLFSSFSSSLSHLHQPSVAQGDGEWGLLSVHSSSSLPLLPHILPCSSLVPLQWGYSLSWGYQVWALLWAVILQDLLHMVFSTRYRPSGIDCFSMSPPKNAAPARKLLYRVSLGCSFLHGLPTCSSMGTSTGCRWMYPTWSSMRCREAASVCHGRLLGVLCSSS